MFTGIVTEVGRLAEVERGPGGARLRVEGDLPGGPLAVGESIAVSGVCLTVESVDDRGFRTTASPETLRLTTLGAVARDGAVNLERALTPGDRMGGHFVQGHVDGVGQVRGLQPEGVSQILSVQAAETLLPHLVERGSVTVDGVSLTVTGVDAAGFQVSLIPETLRRTTLGALRPGSSVNLEADIISKYVSRLLEFRRPALGEAGPDVAAWLATTES